MRRIVVRNLALAAGVVAVVAGGSLSWLALRPSPQGSESLALRTSSPGSESLPVFPETEPKVRKQVFFDYLRPIVHHENLKIRGEREWLLDKINGRERYWFDEPRWRRLAERYRVPEELSDDEVAEVLLRRVDEIPESLVLAQAAKESGWGRSRFAIAGNALFGQRCFSEGCGIVPARRVSGAIHEVRAFDTVADSVASYLLNLNTHDRYKALRLERQRRARAGLPVTGTALAGYATHYSERRDAYVAEIVSLIAQNGLEQPATASAR